MDKLYNSIIELGKGLVGGGNIRFSIAIDSIRFPVSFGYYIQTFMRLGLQLFWNICHLWWQV